MILSLCLLLPALSPTSQDICSAPGTLRVPTLYLSQTSARPGDSVLLRCSVFSKAPATRVIFCKDGEEVSSQRGLLRKVTYDYDHVVSGGSTGNYACGYEIKGRDNRVIKSQLSRAQHLSITEVMTPPAAMSGLRPHKVMTPAAVMSGVPPHKDEKSKFQILQGTEIHRIIEHQGWKGPQEVIQSNPQLKAGPIPNQIIPARALSSLTLKTSKEGDSTTTLGPNLKLLLGITIPAVLVLAVVLYLLGKKENVSTSLITLSHCFQSCLYQGIKGSVRRAAIVLTCLLRRARQQGRLWEFRGHREQVQRDTSNTPEDHIEYASVNWLGSSRLGTVLWAWKMDLLRIPRLQVVSVALDLNAGATDLHPEAEMFNVSKFPLKLLGIGRSNPPGEFENLVRNVTQVGIGSSETDPISEAPAPLADIQHPREKRGRRMQPSLHSGTDVINAPLVEMQDSPVRSRITEPPKIRGNHKGRAARRWGTFSGATAGQCTVT
ncbi:unnamed protein product [Natator depressus]